MIREKQQFVFSFHFVLFSCKDCKKRVQIKEIVKSDNYFMRLIHFLEYVKRSLWSGYYDAHGCLLYHPDKSMTRVDLGTTHHNLNDNCPQLQQQ